MDGVSGEVLTAADREALYAAIRELREENEKQTKELQEIRALLKQHLAETATRDGWESQKKENEDSESTPKPGGRKGMLQAFPTDPSSMDALLEELAQVDDLNVMTGLSQAGRCREVYIEALRQCCCSLDRDIEALQDFALNRDWGRYAMQTHVLKNVFADIGNSFLSDWAGDLEKASDEGDVEQCRKQTRLFCNSVNSFHVKLLRTSLMDKPETDGDDRSHITAGALREKLEALNDACCGCDSAQIDAITDELKTMTFGGEEDSLLKEICCLAESFDYDDIIVLCEQLLKTLPKE